MMTSLVRTIALLLTWAAALLAVLWLPPQSHGHLDTHSICGPWGCGPPISSLVAIHGFWLLLLAPPAAVAAVRLPTRPVRTIGGWLLAIAVLAIAAVAMWQAVEWLPRFSAQEPTYYWRRVAFVLATLVDWPLLQAAFCGMMMLAVAWGRGFAGESVGNECDDPSPRST